MTARGLLDPNKIRHEDTAATCAWMWHEIPSDNDARALTSSGYARQRVGSALQVLSLSLSHAI